MKVFVLCFAFLAIASAQETTTEGDEEGNVKVVQIPGGYATYSDNGHSVVQSSHTSSSSSSSSGPSYNRVSSVSNWQIGPDGKKTGGTTILTDDGSEQNTIQFGDEPPKVTKFEEIPEITFPEIPKFEMPKIQIPQIPTFNFFPFGGFPAPWVPFMPVQQFPFQNMNFNFQRPNGNGNFVGSSSSSVVSNTNGKVSGQTTSTQTLNGDSKTETVQFGN